LYTIVITALNLVPRLLMYNVHTLCHQTAVIYLWSYPHPIPHTTPGHMLRKHPTALDQTPIRI